ncbi:hypothetical protein ACFY5F_35895 [Streptomyces sp. NPDC013161]|uniref:hypothetical protein n=1 Tax=Streptomyces sp. NPDC013161 TaxID=3364862 RepID=UPI0036B915CF
MDESGMGPRSHLSISVARAALESTRRTPLLYAATSLLLLAGLRRNETTRLLRNDWQSGNDPRVTVRGQRKVRRIRVAAGVAEAVEAQLIGAVIKPTESLLPGLHAASAPYRLSQLFQARMREESLHVTVSDLRRAAIAAAIESGTPLAHIREYFGLSRVVKREELPRIPEGFDRRIAALLEEKFAV